MTPRRVAAYLVVATVLAAWLASAAGLGQSAPAPQIEPTPVQTSGTETLADDVQAQAERLRARLAAAPAPAAPSRNPFAFSSAPVPPRRTVAGPSRAPEPAVPMPLPEPALQLAGVAEDASPTGAVRTAIITAETGEILMVKVGEPLGARYRVQAIASDAVELVDLTTGALRRLTLR